MSTPVEPITRRIWRGTAWNTLSQVYAQVLSLLVTVALARMLEPADFGLVATVTIYSGLVSFLAEPGIIAFIIKSEVLEDADIDTAFWIGVLSSALLFFFVLASAPLLGHLYQNPALVPMLQALALPFLLNAYGFVPTALDTKKLRYDRIVRIRMVALTASSLAGVIAANRGLGAWSLIVQTVGMSACQMGLAIAVFQWIPGRKFSVQRARLMLKFGLRVVYNNIVTFAAQNIDYFLISRLSGPASLGFYSMAFRLSRFPLERITAILQSVLWPAFSSIQSDRDRLKRNYLNVTILVPLVAFPALSLLAIYVEDIVLLVIGPQWAGVGKLLLIFMPYLVLMSCCFSDPSMLILKDRLSQIYRARTVALVCTGVLGIPAILRFDMAGMASVYASVTSLYLLYIKVQAAQAVGVKAGEAASHFGALGAYLLVCIIIPSTVSILPGGFWLHLSTSMVSLMFFCMLAYRYWFSGRADPRHF